MLRKRTGKINSKIFIKRDIINIAKYLLTVFDEIKSDRTIIVFNIDFKNGTSIESSDLNMFDEADTNLVESIRFRLRDYEQEKTIFIDLDQKYQYGDYKVEGKDRDWVDAKFSQLKEIINKAKDQNKYFTNTNAQIVLGSISAILPSLALIYLLNSLTEGKVLEEGKSFFAAIFLSFIFGQIIAQTLLSRVYKLFPDIEFDLTYTHINITKRKRNTIKNTFIILILPLLIAIIYDI